MKWLDYLEIMWAIFKMKCKRWRKTCEEHAQQCVAEPLLVKGDSSWHYQNQHWHVANHAKTYEVVYSRQNNEWYPSCAYRPSHPEATILPSLKMPVQQAWLSYKVKNKQGEESYFVLDVTSGAQKCAGPRYDFQSWSCCTLYRYLVETSLTENTMLPCLSDYQILESKCGYRQNDQVTWVQLDKCVA